MAVLQALGLLLVIFKLVTANTPFSSYIFHGGSLNNLTIAINVPQNGTDDLYFHFQSPAGQEWSAFGFGDQMAGALMFVVYANQAQDNVTVSPRIATGHVLPQFTSNVTVQILPGTDIVDGNYIVNARCAGCRKWNGGQIDVTSTSQSMIWAVGPSTTSFGSDDVNYKISQHDSNAMMTLSMDLQSATGEGGVPNVLNITNTNSNGATEDAGLSHFPIALHAFLLIIAFLVVFPGGYLLLRLFERVWLHMAVQTVGLCLVVAGAIAGITLSQTRKISPSLNTPHQIIGLLVFISTLIVWVIGLVGHQMFKKTGHQTIPTKVHRGLGPLTVLLGLVNVGVGFRFADNLKPVVPFYIVTLIVYTLIGGFTYMIKRRRLRREAMNTPAAQNFNEAFQGNGGPPSYEASNQRSVNVPMQTFPASVTQPEAVHHTVSKWL